MTAHELATRWRTDAETLALHGDDRMARVLRTHADDLEAALRAQDDDTLDLATAARESGYSPDRLRHKISAGEIPNAGKKGAPRVRRGDLPIKRRAARAGFDAAAIARAAVKDIPTQGAQ